MKSGLHASLAINDLKKPVSWHTLSKCTKTVHIIIKNHRRTLSQSTETLRTIQNVHTFDKMEGIEGYNKRSQSEGI